MTTFKQTKTTASGVEYTLTYPQYKDLAEAIQVTAKLDKATTDKIRAALQPFKVAVEPLEGVVNQHTKQGSTQAHKSDVRAAITKAMKAMKLKALPDDATEDQVKQRTAILTKHKDVGGAITEHQKLCRGWTLAEARGDGVSNAKAGSLANLYRKKMGDDAFLALMAKEGIKMDDLK